MFTKEDKENYLNNPAYSMALEKFYAPDYYWDLDDEMLDKVRRSNTTIMKAYMYSNENLSKLFDVLPCEGKNVLTTGSSGDQVLNAIFYGANKVTLIDANLYAKHWLDYKISAIKNLTFDEFLDCFFDGYRRGQMFTFECFSKIFQDLPQDSKVFWGTIFANGGYTSEEIFNRILGRGDTGIGYVNCEFYDGQQEYEQFAQILRNNEYTINTINAELSDFNDSLKDEKFDIILLSNISDYVPISKFLPVVNGLYDNHLNDGGLVQVGYSFGNKRSLKEFFLSKDVKVYDCGLDEFTTIIHKPKVNSMDLNEREL